MKNIEKIDKHKKKRSFLTQKQLMQTILIIMCILVILGLTLSILGHYNLI